MVLEKGLEPSIADKIGEYVKHKGGMDLVKKLTADEALINNKSAKAALEDMKLLLHYVELFGIKERVGKNQDTLNRTLITIEATDYGQQW